MARKRKLSHDDASLSLRLYDLRREPVMRESRDRINREFWPDSFQDVLAVADFQHPLNAAFRQTGSYWEMVYGFARNGIIDPDFLVENHGEGLLLFAKMLPFLKEFRKHYSETAFRNAEWISRNSTTGKATLKRLQKRVAAFRQAKG